MEKDPCQYRPVLRCLRSRRLSTSATVPPCCSRGPARLQDGQTRKSLSTFFLPLPTTLNTSSEFATLMSKMSRKVGSPYKTETRDTCSPSTAWSRTRMAAVTCIFIVNNVSRMNCVAGVLKTRSVMAEKNHLLVTPTW